MNLTARRIVLAGSALYFAAVLSLPMAAFAGYSSATKTAKVFAKEGGGSYVFSPTKKTIRTGTKLTWVNTSSEVAHNVTSDTSSWHFKKDLKAGGTLTYTFSKKGTFKYECTIHPGMKGTIVVK